ncbi:MAG: hypothetical protein A2219_06825 [Elusimicrobia bacterium RIFOXYA2_FULL_50_26]|nr:MAG: hypothetical protein A2219_06825 [Elusimicrobia bacterium RIFOXYA2_FULL_50_26]
MENIKEKLAVLIELQQKDSNLDKYRKQMETLPRQVEEKNNLLAGCRAELDEGKKSATQFQLLRKEKEIELATKENDIRKHSMELNSVKSNDAYRALMSEIEKAKQDKSKLEEEILLLMDNIDQESAGVKVKDTELKNNEIKIKVEITALENEYKKMQETLAQLDAARNEYAGKITLELLQRYEFIRSAREGVAIVPINDSSCGGCHITLRPQIINEVYKGLDLVTCDNCSRILYKKEEPA